MRYINEDTLREYAEEFQKLFEKYGVHSVKVDCTPSTPWDKSVTFYVEPDNHSEDLKNDIKTICNRKRLFPILYVYGSEVDSVEWPRVKDAINFNELLNKVRASGNPIKEQISDQVSEIEEFTLEERINLMVEKVNKIEAPTITPKYQSSDLQNVEKG